MCSLLSKPACLACLARSSGRSMVIEVMSVLSKKKEDVDCKTRRVKTTFKVAVRTGLKARLIRHCLKIHGYYGYYG